MLRVVRMAPEEEWRIRDLWRRYARAIIPTLLAGVVAIASDSFACCRWVVDAERFAALSLSLSPPLFSSPLSAKSPRYSDLTGPQRAASRTRDFGQLRGLSSPQKGANGNRHRPTRFHSSC
jgi:hypothetical protein